MIKITTTVAHDDRDDRDYRCPQDVPGDVKTLTQMVARWVPDNYRFALLVTNSHRECHITSTVDQDHVLAQWLKEVGDDLWHTCGRK